MPTLKEHLKIGVDGNVGTLKDAKTHLIDDLKKKTTEHVLKHIPEWQQSLWWEYTRIHEKKEVLTELEAIVYLELPDTEESKENAFVRCKAGIMWAMQCRKVCNDLEKVIMSIKTSDEILGIPEPVFPVWPLGGVNVEK